MPYYKVEHTCGMEGHFVTVIISKHAETIPKLIEWLNAVMIPDLEKIFKSVKLESIIEEP